VVPLLLLVLCPARRALLACTAAGAHLEKWKGGSTERRFSQMPTLEKRNEEKKKFFFQEKKKKTLSSFFEVSSFDLSSRFFRSFKRWPTSRSRRGSAL